ncbi:MAG: hypothetical protein GYA46_03670 [candidate division Zixibacteria bacterium]|nr:hypothetical protein [candidate division Zixibacteria bacterium]
MQRITRRCGLGLLGLYGGLALWTACGSDEPTQPQPSVPPSPVCEKTDSLRADNRTPISHVADWGQPVRLGSPVNTLCPQDAIEISRDGRYLYVMYTEDILTRMSSEQILARHNNTYRLERIGGPDEFGEPEFYDMGKGIGQSFNGELSFSPNDSLVYFHSLRATNLGYQQDPPVDDFLDIYVADIIDSLPGPGRNLGPRVNSIYADGEAAIHPDGVMLYFGSLRPGGSGKTDIWSSTFDGSDWSDPVNLGATINSSEDDYQPTFTPDGDTMYYASAGNIILGMAIYRSVRTGGVWGAPQLVISGLAGEPTLTADGQLLYFIHVLSDAGGNYDADVWYCPRIRK